MDLFWSINVSALVIGLLDAHLSFSLLSSGSLEAVVVFEIIKLVSFVTVLAMIVLKTFCKVISRKCTEHINQTGTEHFLGNTCFIPKDKVISLLQLVLNYSVFSFQGKFYQLKGAAMGSSVSPVIASICMEYFEELALGPQCPIPTPWWKRYVEDINNIVKKEQIDTSTI